jgi:hypothetical protein
VPVDTAALVALSDLAAQQSARSADDPPAPDSERTAPPASDPGRAPSPARRRLAALAVTSIGAGLVCGLVLPLPAEAGAPTAAALAGTAHRTTPSVAPALLAVPSPFAAARGLARTTVPAARPARASTAAGPSAAAPRRAATPLAGVPAARVRAADPLPPRAGGPAPAYVPTRPLPARSGTGRRIVYAERAAHLWVVGADGAVLRDYPVTGRAGRPKPGVYHVYSKSTVAVNPGEKLRFEYMVRFAVGITGARIGFHTIPRYYDGVPIQSESQLGRAIGAGGCVRQTRADARWLYGWSRVGDTVVVLR